MAPRGLREITFVLLVLLAANLARAGEGDPPTPPIVELARQLSSTDLGVRQHAAWSLWLRQEEAVAAAVALAAAVRDEDEYVRNTAAKAVQNLLGRAPNAAPELAKGLTDERVEVRRLAAGLLPWANGNVLAARDALEVALATDPDDFVRAQAANALRMLPREEADPVGPTLVKALDDPAPEVRAQAVYALSWLDLPGSLQAGIRLLDDPVAAVRIRALEAIQPRQDLPASLAEKAAELLLDDDVEVRRRAAFLAGRFPERHEAVVPALLASLASDEYRNRTAAAVSLGAIGPADSRIPRALASALDVGYDSLTGAAAMSLVRMGPDALIYLPNLGRALPGMTDENSRNKVVVAIRKILEPVLDETVGALETDAGAARDSASLRAAAVLVRLRGEDPGSLVRLVNGLYDDRNHWSVMWFLADLGDLASPAVSLLEEMASGTDAVAVRATLVLARLGKDGAEAAFERLLAILDAPEDARRALVARNLSSYLPGRPETLPVLLKILEGDNPPALRAAAAQALGTIGPTASEALPALRAAEQESHALLSACARSAIERVTSGDESESKEPGSGAEDPGGD